MVINILYLELLATSTYNFSRTYASLRPYDSLEFYLILFRTLILQTKKYVRHKSFRSLVSYTLECVCVCVCVCVSVCVCVCVCVCFCYRVRSSSSFHISLFSIFNNLFCPSLEGFPLSLSLSFFLSFFLSLSLLHTHTHTLYLFSYFVSKIF